MDEPVTTSSSTQRQLHSETITKLVPALIKAQTMMTGAVKDAKNPHFGSDYASLLSCIKGSFPYLLANGISPSHQTYTTPTGNTVLVFTLYHTSGEWLRSEYPLRPEKDTCQGLFAAGTYARRATLMAMAGLAPVDDDGETAMGRGQAFQQPRAATPAMAAAKAAVKPPKTNLEPDAGFTTRPYPAEPDGSAYVVPFGKYKGKRFAEIPKTDIVNYMAFINKSPNPSKAGGEFIVEANKYLGAGAH